jgi:hypothetical protein
MPFKLQFGENTALILFCCGIGLVAVVFFIVIFVSDFQESRRKAKKKRDYERALQHAHRRRQRQP